MLASRDSKILGGSSLGIVTILFLSLYISTAHADVVINGNVVFNTKNDTIYANATKIDAYKVYVDGNGLGMQFNSTEPYRVYNFTSNANGHVNIQMMQANYYVTNFRAYAPTMTDLNGYVNGSKMINLWANYAQNFPFTWTSSWNKFLLGSNTIVSEVWHSSLISQAVKALVGLTTTPLVGTIYQSNLTSLNNPFALSTLGTVTIKGTADIQNYSALDSASLFIVKKQYNWNVTSQNIPSPTTLTMNTNIIPVTCPLTGSTPAFWLYLSNETVGHIISSYGTPVCYSNSTVKWWVLFNPNGNSANTYTTSVKLQIFNSTYDNNANGFTANGTSISTAFILPWIYTSPITVGTGLQHNKIFYSMNLIANSAINYTAGNITIAGSNGITFPITITQQNTSNTQTQVGVTYPNSYNMTCQVFYANEGTNKTYYNIPSSPAGIGQLQSLFNFNNASNDVITINCHAVNSPSNSASYVVKTSNGNIPLVQDILNFRNGTYGTHGQLGALDLVTLSVLIISMVGLNRVNETLGLIVMVMVMGGLSYFGIITFPSVMIPAIALVLLITTATTKKLPWS